MAVDVKSGGAHDNAHYFSQFSWQFAYLLIFV